MNGSLTPLGVMALAVLAEGDMHPYEMYQLMLARSEDRVVKLSPGSLYRAVERFAAGGLIAEVGVEREGNRPERTVYTITEAGRAALREAIAAMLGRRAVEFPEFPVAIGEAHHLPVHEVVELIGARLDGVEAALGELDAALHRIGERGVPTAYVLDVHYRRAMLAAEARWLRGTIADLGSGALAWPETASGSEPRRPKPSGP